MESFGKVHETPFIFQITKSTTLIDAKEEVNNISGIVFELRLLSALRCHQYPRQSPDLVPWADSFIERYESVNSFYRTDVGHGRVPRLRDEAKTARPTR